MIMSNLETIVLHEFINILKIIEGSEFLLLWYFQDICLYW